MSSKGTIWDRVDRLIDSSPELTDLRAHGIHLLAARRWRELGHAVPPDLALEERRAAMVTLPAPALLEQVRAACEGPIIVLKGPEVASRYPIGGGPRSADFHHLHPLQSPQFPLRVEIHSRPSWVDGLEPPPLGEFLSVARPAALGVDGIFGRAVRPMPGESWPAKLRRAFLAVRHAFMGRSDHERAIGFRR